MNVEKFVDAVNAEDFLIVESDSNGKSLVLTAYEFSDSKCGNVVLDEDAAIRLAQVIFKHYNVTPV